MKHKKLNDSIVFKDNQFTKRVVFNDEEVLGFVLNFKKGQTLPFHNHEQSALTLLVLQGSAELKVGNETQTISKGSVVLANGNEEFGIPRVDEDLSLFVTLTPRPKEAKYAQEIN